MAEIKSKVDNIVPRYPKIESPIAVQITSTTEQMVTNEVSMLMECSLDSILQCVYENVRTGAHPVVDIVVERVLFDLLCWKVMDEIMDKQIANYSDPCDAADRNE